MKVYFIFSILCLAATSSLSLPKRMKREMEDIAKQAVRECARELNIDENKYMHGIKLDDYMKNPNKEATCMNACVLPKLIPDANKELKGSDDRETMYNAFMFVIDGAYAKNATQLEAKYHRQDVINNIEKCYTSARNDCEAFSCVEPHKSPYFDVLVQFYNNAIYSATHSPKFSFENARFFS